MGWEHELDDIVRRSRRVPTFGEWLKTIECPEMNCASPLAMRSLITTLYRRYQRQYGL